MTKIDSVCIIDDDPIFVYGARKLMEISNFCDNVLIFRNGLDALEHFKPIIERKEKLPQVILLDINMPIMDGWQFLDEFVKIYTDIPSTINIVSSYIDPRDKAKAKRYSEVSSYIVKPISMKAISAIKKDLALPYNQS
ncbi:Response regulator receiver domain-containing protein [Flavobacteriaceae bacterium MAR_2010_188]|nr:Response regulator receiver domain-containing protein [Flavobacteriaceae bacterium MAR_2010_188]